MTLPWDHIHQPVVYQLSPEEELAAKVSNGFDVLRRKLDDLEAGAERVHAELSGESGPMRWLFIDLADPFNTQKDPLEGTPLADWLVREALEAIERARSSLEELYADMKPYLEHVGNAKRLKEVSRAWVELVAGPISERAGWFTENKMLVDNYWSEGAAEAYADMLPAQETATIAIKEQASRTGAALLDLAHAIEDFWSDMASEVANAASKAARHAFGWLSLDAAERVGEIIADLIEIAQGIIDALHKASVAYEKGIRSLVDVLNSNEHFPSASWPTSGEPLPVRSSQWKPEGAG